MTDRLLTTKDAAAFLGVSAAFLERDRWANVEVPYVRVGSRAVRYQLSELEAYVNSNRRRPTRSSERPT
jgi:predicted DNA-binding transcriptional regulator AlpA